MDIVNTQEHDETHNPDLIEVIRCSKCIHHWNSERNLWCHIYNMIMPENGYCCFGEAVKERL